MCTFRFQCVRLPGNRSVFFSFFFTPIMSLSDFILSSEFISALGRRVEGGSWDELAGKPSLQPSRIDTIHIIYFTLFPPTPFFMFRHLYATVIFTFCLTVLLVLISITMSERRGVSVKILSLLRRRARLACQTVSVQ